ncbi:hypothetical protein ACODT3_19370 [Streptomyces sp. 4.24]|uniref:hypothetical protein n=1 Tax=Streptomyces tritrimontium TaxID=3406573 RepID=UPI003BB7880A
MMITREQMATAAASATLAGGLVAFVANAAGPRKRLACSGLRLALSAVPLVIITRARRSQQQVQNSATSHHREGYWLGLNHAARGLLLTPPPDSHGQGAPAQDAPDRLSAVPSPKNAEGLINGKPQ